MSLLVLILLLNSQIQMNDSLAWDETRKLRYEDFQSLPYDTGPTFYGGKAIAATCAALKYDLLWNPSFTGLGIQVQAIFIKSQSFMIKKEERSLRHEQIHFDLTELYARKIRKLVYDINDTSIYVNVNVVQNLINGEIKKHREAQKDYDKGTWHGNVEEAQRDWEKKVSKELMKLEVYKLNY